jgi:hypothetical protein
MTGLRALEALRLWARRLPILHAEPCFRCRAGCPVRGRHRRQRSRAEPAPRNSRERASANIGAPRKSELLVDDEGSLGVRRPGETTGLRARGALDSHGGQPSTEGPRVGGLGAGVAVDLEGATPPGRTRSDAMTTTITRSAFERSISMRSAVERFHCRDKLLLLHLMAERRGLPGGRASLKAEFGPRTRGGPPGATLAGRRHGSGRGGSAIAAGAAELGPRTSRDTLPRLG